MVNLAIVENGVIVTYPATKAQCRAHVGDRSVGENALASGELEQYGIFIVAETTPPSITEAQRLVEDTPINIGGTWTQQWSVVNFDSQEIAAKLMAARHEINSLANAAMPDLSEGQRLAIMQVHVARLEQRLGGTPTALNHPIVGAVVTATGGTLADALMLIDEWAGEVTTVVQAQAAALKELNDNGVLGIPAARAIMEAL